MTDLTEKLRAIDFEKDYRQGGKNHIPLWFNISVGVILVAAVLTGAWIGIKSNYMMVLEDEGADNQYVVDEYKITFLPDTHPEMKGDTMGFTQVGQSDDIFIEEGHDLETVEIICNHELMHAKGIGGEHHDFIYRNHDVVQSDVCNELVERVESDRDNPCVFCR